jgi:hypothetical protein
MRPIVLLLSVGCMVASTLAQDTQKSAAPASARARQDEDLERLRRDLARGGPEGRRARETAVHELLSLRHGAAHAVLQETLRSGDDQDGLSRYLLRALDERLRNPRDLVFQQPPAEPRAELHRAWVPVLVGCIAGAPDAAPDGSSTSFAGLARSCLLALDRVELEAGLRRLLQETDLATRLAAVRACSEARSLNLAPVLATVFDDPQLGAQARAALGRLTFQPDGFSSRAEFERWFREHSGDDYLALAERAAREGQQRLAAARNDARGQQLRLLLELVEAYVSTPEIAWKKLHQLVLEQADVEQRLRCLLRLRDLLAAAERTGGVAADRLAFFDALRRRLESNPPADEHAALLELAAAVVTDSDTEPRTYIVKLLRDTLNHSQHNVRRAAIAGLGRFPAREQGAALVRAGLDAHREGDQVLLGAVLTALQRKGWYAPAAEGRNRTWLELLGKVLRDPKLGKALREQAVQILGQRDREQKSVPEAFDLLASLAVDPKIEPELRESAMIQLGVFIGDAARWESFGQLLAQAVGDENPRIRDRAASLIQHLSEPPPQARVQETHAVLQDALRKRLVAEPDAAILKSVVEAGKRLFDPKGDPEPVLVRLFCAALEETVQRGNGAGQEFRRPLLAEAITSLASTQVSQPIVWVRAAESLAQANDRTALRYVLARQKAASLDPAQVQPEIVQRAQRLVLRAAQMRRAGEALPADEAEEVLRAFAGLERANQPLEGDDLARLKLEALSTAKQHSRVLEFAGSLLSAPARPGDEPLRAQAAVALARSHLALQQLAESKKALDLVPTGLRTDDVLAFQEDLTRALLGAGQGAECATLAEGLLQLTPASAACYRDRVLLCAEALLAAGGKESEALALLNLKSGLFEGADVPPALVQKRDALLQKAKGQRPGG